MEHAERLCDRIILMASGEKVFDGTTEEALAQAPRRVILGSESDGLTELIAPFAAQIETRASGDLTLTLKPGAQAHDILERSVAQNLRHYMRPLSHSSARMCVRIWN